MRNAPCHHKPHLAAVRSKPRPFRRETAPTVNRSPAFLRPFSILPRSPTSCQLPSRLLSPPTPPKAAAPLADSKSSVQLHFEPRCKTEPPSAPRKSSFSPLRVTLLEGFLFKLCSSNPDGVNVNQPRRGQRRTQALGKMAPSHLSPSLCSPHPHHF